MVDACQNVIFNYILSFQKIVSYLNTNSQNIETYVSKSFYYANLISYSICVQSYNENFALTSRI